MPPRTVAQFNWARELCCLQQIESTAQLFGTKGNYRIYIVEIPIWWNCICQKQCVDGVGRWA